MDLVPAPMSGAKVTPEWFQVATDTANELASSVLNIVRGTLTIPASTFFSTKTAIGTYYRSNTVQVTFPEGSFTKTPMIVCAANGTAPGNIIELTFNKPTKNGFIACVGRGDNPTGGTTYDWVAMGATQ